MLTRHLLRTLAQAVLISTVSLCLSYLLTPCRVFKALENPDLFLYPFSTSLDPIHFSSPGHLCWKLQRRVRSPHLVSACLCIHSLTSQGANPMGQEPVPEGGAIKTLQVFETIPSPWPLSPHAVKSSWEQAFISCE